MYLDVMGLGKTVQTIAFLAWLRSKNRDTDNVIVDPQDNLKRVKPHIIIVPASVMDNWLGEFKKFAPHVVVVK
jgi:SWI/SNF-related matrix-associated actin-dependent regulator of chromatin subfamily A containing DEAD/H box 1